MNFGKEGARGGFGSGGALGRLGIPNVYNLTASNTSRWTAALAARAAGTRDAVIGFVGDSHTLGKNTGNFGLTQNLDRQNGSPAQFAAMLRSADTPLPSNYQGIFGTGAGAATFNAIDSRLVQTSGTGWAQGGGASTFTAGGPVIGATAAGTFVATPTAAWDTCIIRYPLRTLANSPGVFSYQVDAGAATNVDSTTAGTDRTSASVTISAGSVGNHTLTVVWVSGTALLNSIEFYDSTSKSVRVRNFGWSGTTTTDWNAATYGTAPLNELVHLACDAYVVSFQANDLKTSIPLATSQSNLTTIINALNAVGDVYLMSGAPFSTAEVDGATQDSFIAMQRALAFSLGIPFLDGYGRMGGSPGYALYNAAPYQWYFDTDHLDRVGQGDRAAFEYPILKGPPTYNFKNYEAAIISESFSTAPVYARKILIDNLVSALKAAGVWAALDLLYVAAAADSQAAAVNWKNPGIFTLSPTNSPTFVTDRGFTGNGTSSRLDTGWAPGTNGVNFAQNSNSLWVWSLTDGQTSTVDIGRAGGTGLYNIRCWNSATGNQAGAASDAGDTGVTQTSGLGLFGVQRLGASQKRYWHNGAQIGADLTTASVALNTGTAWVCGANSTGFSTRQQAAAAFGASLGGLESAFYAALQTYMQGVGAA